MGREEVTLFSTRSSNTRSCQHQNLVAPIRVYDGEHTMPKPGSPILPKNPLLSSKNSPNLIELIQQDLAAMGIVGEEDAALLVYLAYSSRKQPVPLSIIIKGPSGSGKTNLQRKPAELIPKADIIEATDSSAQSLYYFPTNYLKHKLLIGGERKHQDDDEQRDKTGAIRQLISGGTIFKTSIVNMESVQLRVDGPISYSETTTQENIFPEDAKRYIHINTKPSPELSRRILDEKGKQCDKRYRYMEKDKQSIRERHWEFQNALFPYAVSVPFGSQLTSKIPTDKTDSHRICDQIITLIQVITYLHQFQRKVDSDNFLESTIEDYIVAKRLMSVPFEQTLGQRADLDEWIDPIPEEQFTTDQATGAWDSNSRKVTNSKLKKLADAGLIVCLRESVGNKPALWKKTGRSSAILPSPELLIE